MGWSELVELKAESFRAELEFKLGVESKREQFRVESKELSPELSKAKLSS